MKANLLKSVFVIVIALVSGINVFNAQKPAVLSDVAMENVEALANMNAQAQVVVLEPFRGVIVIIVVMICGLV